MTEKENGMKRIIAAKGFLVGMLVCGMAAGASAEVVAYWPFGMNGLDDASGNGHSLTNSGVGLSGGTAVFGGTPIVFCTASTLDLRACTKLTVEYFIKSTSKNNAVVFEHSENAGTYVGGFCSAFNDFTKLGNLTAVMKISSTGYYVVQTGANVAGDGSWHHVALVFDSTLPAADRLKLYFDKSRQSNSSSGSAFPAFLDAKLFIGSRANTGFWFTGCLDDVRISDQALSTNQFLQLPTLAPEVAYWPFAPGAEI